MKRLTSILAISVIAVMSAGAARADIASTTYVDTKAAANAKEIAKKENVANKVVSGGDMETALKAADADTKYPTLKATMEIATIAAGAATATYGELANHDTVSTKLIDNGAVTTEKIADLNVTTGKIAENAVTSAKIANGTIVDADIATNANIATSKISGLDTTLAGKENVANKVTTISAASTNTQYPSAKAVYDELAKKQNNITIDSALSSDSTNPVQNKVVNTALAGKLGKTENAVSATKATQDGNGNPIATTYATKTELGTKQNKLVSSGENANITGSNGVTVTVGTDGKIAVSGSKSAIDAAIAKKQNTLTTEQLSAVNSGITAAKVTTYDGYDATIKANTSAAAAAKTAADAAQATANAKEASANKTKTYDAAATDKDTKFPTISAAEAIADAKVAGANTDIAKLKNDVAANKTAIAGKQATLNATQLNAVNSGITSAKVTTYDGYDAKITAAQTKANNAVVANAAITAGTGTKITYDAKGLVTGSASLTASDIPTLATSKISGLDTALAGKIPVPSATNNNGKLVLTYDSDTKAYAWESIGR